MREFQFDYFYYEQADQYSFFRIPKILVQNPRFKELSDSAKLLYGLMLDRMDLSRKNNWIDEEGRVYIVYTVEDIMEQLNCGRGKAVKLIAELDSDQGVGLIEKRRVGFGSPNMIYVKNFVTVSQTADISAKMHKNNGGNEKEISDLPKVRKSNFLKSENRTTEVRKSNSNQTNNNKTDKINTNQSCLSNKNNNYIPQELTEKKTDTTDAINRCRERIRENISYPELTADPNIAPEEVDELVELIVEIMTLPDDTTVRVSKQEKSAAVMKSQFSKLEKRHILFVLERLEANRSKVRNIKAYLLTTLYNALLTTASYQRQKKNQGKADSEVKSEALRKPVNRFHNYQQRDTDYDALIAAHDTLMSEAIAIEKAKKEQKSSKSYLARGE